MRVEAADGDEDSGDDGGDGGEEQVFLEEALEACASEVPLRTWVPVCSPPLPHLFFPSTVCPAPSPWAPGGCSDPLSTSQASMPENKGIANAVNPRSNLFVISTHLKCTCYP